MPSGQLCADAPSCVLCMVLVKAASPDRQAPMGSQCSREALYLCQPTCFVCNTSQPPFLMCRQAAPRGGGSCSAAQLRPDRPFPTTELQQASIFQHGLALYNICQPGSQPSFRLPNHCVFCAAMYYTSCPVSPEDIRNSIWALAVLRHTHIIIACSALPCFVSNRVVSSPPWAALQMCASCMCEFSA